VKAFMIDRAADRRAEVDLGYDLFLPELECLECCPEWKSWGVWSTSYPAFQFPFLKPEEFNADRVVSLEEFGAIARRIEAAAGRRVNLLPGAGIGRLSGHTSSTRLDDFVWGTVVPQISRRALELLAGEGVTLLTAECDIRYRGRRLDSHKAIQVEPVAMMTDESLARFKFHRCPRCGNYVGPRPPSQHIVADLEGYRSMPPFWEIISEGYIMRKSAWPAGQHLIQMEEAKRVLASEAFIEAVRKHGLTGIKFVECGELV
jgi:hypothetical protein